MSFVWFCNFIKLYMHRHIQYDMSNFSPGSDRMDWWAFAPKDFRFFGYRGLELTMIFSKTLTFIWKVVWRFSFVLPTSNLWNQNKKQELTYKWPLVRRTWSLLGQPLHILRFSSIKQDSSVVFYSRWEFYSQNNLLSRPWTLMG